MPTRNPILIAIEYLKSYTLFRNLKIERSIKVIGVPLTNDEKIAIDEYLFKKNLPLDTAVTFSNVWIPEKFNCIRSRSEIWNKPELSFRTELFDEIALNYPIFSANMMSVTGLEMALAMLRVGGGYFLPQMLNLEDRLSILEHIRRADCAFIEDPLVINKSNKLSAAKEKMNKYGIWSLVVVNDEGKAVGMLSSRDWRYETNNERMVESLMSKPVITCWSSDGLKTAKRIMREKKIEKLPVIDANHKLIGLYTAHGVFYEMRHPQATRSSLGQFPLFGSVRVGKSLTSDTIKEIESQIKLGVRVMLVDTARAYAINLEEIVTYLRDNYPRILIIAGNVSTAQGAKALFEWGTHIVKVNQGRGSQCLTSLQTGVGQPQITAIAECSVIAKKYKGKIIADGGMHSPSDFAKAFIAGAHFVMTGQMLVGTYESPAEIVPRRYEGKEFLVKKYEGSASAEAQKKRIVEGTLDELREPEGDWDYVPLSGSVKQKVLSLFKTNASTMTYHGAMTLDDLREFGHFGNRLQSRAGYDEGSKHRAD